MYQEFRYLQSLTNYFFFLWKSTILEGHRLQIEKRKRSDSIYWKGSNKCVIVFDDMAGIIPRARIPFLILFTLERKEREVALWNGGNLHHIFNSSSFHYLLSPSPLIADTRHWIPQLLFPTHFSLALSSVANIMDVQLALLLVILLQID